MARLQQIYREKISKDLTEKFGYKSPMQVPRITKITLNMGVGEAVADKKVLDNAVGDRFAHAHVERDLGQTRDLHRRGVAELLGQVLRDFFAIDLLETCHVSTP